MNELSKLININIENQAELVTPADISNELKASEKSYQTVLNGRNTIRDILDGKDKRLFIIVGPCSIHDPKSALEYATRLQKLSDEVNDKLFLIMRVYFEKPRTTVGWKGLINDPDLDDSFKLEKGLRLARKLLIQFTEMGLPTGTEALDPITPQYLSDLVCWSAIGARTTESQTHREMASGLSMPVGFKNGTDGSIEVAINALESVKTSHHFLGINYEGKISRFKTKGNSHSHIVLRGGVTGPNFDSQSIKKTEELLKKKNLLSKIVVDCSHANSNKDHNNQPKVLDEVLKQITSGNKAIAGFMIESHLHEGNQNIPEDLSQLKYGVSITDKCVNWETTQRMIKDAYQRLK